MAFNSRFGMPSGNNSVFGQTASSNNSSATPFDSQSAFGNTPSGFGGFTPLNQNQGNGFQQPNSIFAPPTTSSAPSSTQSPFGSSTGGGFGFGTTASAFSTTASAPSSAQSPFSLSTGGGFSLSTGGGFGFGTTCSPFSTTASAPSITQSPFGSSTGGGFNLFGTTAPAFSTTTSVPSTTQTHLGSSTGGGFGFFGTTTPAFSTTTSGPSGLTPFGSSTAGFGFSTTAPAFSTPTPFGGAPFSASGPNPSNSGFGFATSSGSFTSSLPQTHIFGVRPAAFNSAPANSSTSTFEFPNPGSQGSPTRGPFDLNHTGIFGIPSSSGATVSENRGSRVASYSVTRADEETNRGRVAVTFRSISAMRAYENKSHEELRFEDYDLSNKGGQKSLADTSSSLKNPLSPPTNIFSNSPSPFAPKSHGFPSFTPNNSATTSTTTTIFPPPMNSVSNPNNPFAPVSSNSFFTPNNNVSTSTSQAPFSNPSFNSVAPQPQPFFNTTSTSPAFTPSVSSPFSNTTTNIFARKTSPFSTISTAPSMNPFNSFTPQPQLLFAPNTTTSTTPAFPPFSRPNNFFSPQPNNPFSTISTAPTPSPFTSNLFPTQTTSTSNVNLFSIKPFSHSMPTSNSQFPPLYTTSTTSTVSPFQPLQDSSGLRVAKEVGTSPGFNVQQPPRTESIQPSVVENPFGPRPAVLISIGQPNAAVTLISYGISGMPVLENPSPAKKESLLRIRHVSLRHSRLPSPRHGCESTETKVAFFSDKEDRPTAVSPFQPRDNPRAWITNTLSGQGPQSSPTNENGSSFQVNLSSIDDTYSNDEDFPVILKLNQGNDTKEKEGEALARIPKLGHEEYYTEPSIEELTAKERAEPGFCSCVKDFVVGRKDYGSIKFFGETDICGLNLDSIVQFDHREVIVYPDDKKKPPIGKSLNKPAEVTLLNIKCVSKKTGKHFVDGPQVQSFKEVLIKKAKELGVEFVSYDPVRGEWKFRVQHF